MAARRAPLRAVPPSEGAPARPARAKTVTQAAASGTTRELLVAMRARIAKAVEDSGTPARDLAALTKRLLEVARDIEAIDARDEPGETGVEDVGDGEFDSAAV